MLSSWFGFYKNIFKSPELFCSPFMYTVKAVSIFLASIAIIYFITEHIVFVYLLRKI